MAAAPSPSEVVDRRGGEGEGINVNVSSKRIFGSDPRWRRPAISGGEKSVGDPWGKGDFLPGAGSAAWFSADDGEGLKRNSGCWRGVAGLAPKVACLAATTTTIRHTDGLP